MTQCATAGLSWEAMVPAAVFKGKVPQTRVYSSYLDDTPESRRVLRRYAKSLYQTPWSWVKDLAVDLKEYLLDEITKDAPSWVDEWELRRFLDFVPKRNGGVWSVKSHAIFDPKGEIDTVEFYEANFEVVPVWKHGKAKCHRGEFFEVTYKNGNWETVFQRDIDILRDWVLVRFGIPKKAGFTAISEL